LAQWLDRSLETGRQPDIPVWPGEARRTGLAASRRVRQRGIVVESPSSKVRGLQTGRRQDAVEEMVVDRARRGHQ
jgi:hypothetical protein